MRANARALARASGLSHDTIRKRLLRGLSVHDACQRTHYGRPVVDWSWTEADDEWVREHGPASRREVAERLGISVEAVRLIEVAGLESLRRSGGLDVEWFAVLHHVPDDSRYRDTD